MPGSGGHVRVRDGAEREGEAPEWKQVQLMDVLESLLKTRIKTLIFQGREGGKRRRGRINEAPETQRNLPCC